MCTSEQEPQFFSTNIIKYMTILTFSNVFNPKVQSGAILDY